MHAYGGQGYGPVNEVTFYADQGVLVTSTRFVAFGQMYPMNGITSVSPFTVPASRVGLIIGAAFFGLGTLGGLVTLLGQGEGAGGVVVCAVITGLFVWGIISRKDVHGIIISTGGGQVRALQSTNLPLVHAVLAALHQAVAARG